ncbi:MAG TPA: DUF2235 domain-containing protein [Chloroflexia bacterium]|nr:DUF2235 domain-containing protein [Chloroflexia bacterium]
MNLRRLVVCLDGTWNNRDDSTNVLHQFSLVRECTRAPQADGSTLTQLRFYHEGVGTGPLDSITGGGFGFGLEANVRAAYNWLVQNYQEGDPLSHTPPDEIYVFGFSRGAYTARSLVGFIAACGLLRRGAPLPVTQLWENYRLLGREYEERTGLWDNREEPEFRRMSDLLVDAWLPEGDALRIPYEKLNLTERELVHCSRRVQITYLGVYDTVGAMGWDALAIPGLRSHMAQHHNMRPSTIIRKCRHALGIDEHRSSFKHTPLVAYLGDARADLEVERTGEKKTVQQFWRDRIEQRWFLGAHSNIGGGYADNVLAQTPLRWVFDGAVAQGLQCETPGHPAAPPANWPTARDSYAEFAAPLWRHLIRAKRYFREMDPDPDLHAARNVTADGLSLESIQETVDPSVWEYWRKTPDEAPPNLVSYQERRPGPAGLRLRAHHAWLDEKLGSQLWLIAWSTFALIGVSALDRVFLIFRDVSANLVWLTVLFTALLPLLDLVDSKMNFARARGRRSAWFAASVHVTFWARSACVLLCLAGVLGTLDIAIRQGWRAASPANAYDYLLAMLEPWWFVPVAATAGVLIAHALCGRLRERWAAILGALVAGCGGVTLALFALSLMISLLAGFAGAVRLPPLVTSAVTGTAQEIVAGQLLLVQLMLAAMFGAFRWVSEPLSRRNLGSIRLLQRCVSTVQVARLLRSWTRRLGAPMHAARAADTMRHAVYTALWRDTVGFIPVYTLALTTGLYFAAVTLGGGKHELWTWLDRGWWLLPLFTALSDLVENTCHGHYARLDLAGKAPPQWLVSLGTLSTLVKFAGLLVGLALIVSAVLSATGQIVQSPSAYGWRGAVAIVVTSLPILWLLAAIGGAITQRMKPA